MNDRYKRIQEKTIISNRMITDNIFEMVLLADDIAGKALPGQFVNLYSRESRHMLPRPISICDFDSDKGTITIIYAVVGAVTKELSHIPDGETVQLLGPLGNGFDIRDSDAGNIIIAGGVGTPPMLGLARRLGGSSSIFLGFRSQPFLIERFEELGTVHIATDTGAFGFHGNVVSHMEALGTEGERFFACGPKPMLRAVQSWSSKHLIEGQISLEERMGCGIGTCVGCVVKILDDSNQGWSHRKVCKDGPVFNSREVIF